jgi:hypothetical protein
LPATSSSFSTEAPPPMHNAFTMVATVHHLNHQLRQTQKMLNREHPLPDDYLVRQSIWTHSGRIEYKINQVRTYKGEGGDDGARSSVLFTWRRGWGLRSMPSSCFTAFLLNLETGVDYVAVPVTPVPAGRAFAEPMPMSTQLQPPTRCCSSGAPASP